MMTTSNAARETARACGVLGLAPFLALPVALLAWPAWAALTVAVVAAYAALILSFLGGARWGAALKDADPDPRNLALAMVPTLAAWALLIIFHGAGRMQLAGLAAALVLAAVWDIRSTAAMSWYEKLRLGLTAGATLALGLGAALVR